MTQAVLTLNTGSSSIKSAVFSAEKGTVNEEPLFKVNFSGIGSTPRVEKTWQRNEVELVPMPDGDHRDALRAVLDAIEASSDELEIVGIGHRIVHGGLKCTQPVALTEKILAELEVLSPLAPGHQPHNLNGVAISKKSWPGAVQVGCFDTAFHRTQSKVAYQFGLPYSMTEDGIIRYGFHGLSYEYISGIASDLIGILPGARMIVAHLGGGASMCAIHGGKSVASTMGFSAIDGLPMGTRCGDIDPGVVFYLIEQKGMSAPEVADMLYSQSGMLGISGISADMRALIDSEEARAANAVDYFTYRCAREIGSLTAALGGVDALVFTAGVGENSAVIRSRVLEHCAWLGFTIDQDANVDGSGKISANKTGPSAWVVPTNEELMIARHTAKVIAQ